MTTLAETINDSEFFFPFSHRDYITLLSIDSVTFLRNSGSVFRGGWELEQMRPLVEMSENWRVGHSESMLSKKNPGSCEKMSVRKKFNNNEREHFNYSFLFSFLTYTCRSRYDHSNLPILTTKELFMFLNYSST